METHVSTLIGIEWTSDAETEAIRREQRDRQLVREYVSDANERREQHRRWRRERLEAALAAIGVSLAGVLMLVWLLVGWLR
jgi:hypothetical protein